jgi:hypothetical protein
MAVQSSSASAPNISSTSSSISDVYREGIVAGVIGAAAIALWFFVLDIISGRPFYTPSVLGTALFRRGIEPDQLQNLPVSFEMVLFYTWVHGMVFCVIGGGAAKLLALAEENLSLGFGILLFFVIFEFGFFVMAFVFAEPLLHALAWPAVLVGNLLAATGMAFYFWRHHPNLKIEP